MGWIPDISYQEFESIKESINFNLRVTEIVIRILERRIPDSVVLQNFVANIIVGKFNPNAFEDIRFNSPLPRTNAEAAYAQRLGLKVGDDAKKPIRELATALAAAQIQKNPRPGPKGHIMREKELGRYISTHLNQVLRGTMASFRGFV